MKSHKDGSYYIGVTNDLDERLSRHNAGHVKSTKNKRPLIRIFSKAYESKSEAMDRERKLKNLKSRKRIQEWMKKQSPSAENT